MEQRVLENPQHRTASGELKLPLDLSEWLGPWRLVAWVQEEVECLDPLNDGCRPLFDPRLMLRLLSFAYASRVFESDEIIKRCYTDPIFRQLCENEPPSAAQLRGFRRMHRQLLERILARLLLRAVREKFELDPAVSQPELESDMSDRATERLNIARHMDQS